MRIQDAMHTRVGAAAFWRFIQVVEKGTECLGGCLKNDDEEYCQTVHSL